MKKNYSKLKFVIVGLWLYLCIEIQMIGVQMMLVILCVWFVNGVSVEILKFGIFGWLNCRSVVLCIIMLCFGYFGVLYYLNWISKVGGCMV